MTFASRSLLEHLARGAVGIGALAFAVTLSPTHPLLMVVALPVALVMLRGCPMCWTVGLVQTIAAKLQGRSTEGLCVDGSCAVNER